MRLRKERTIVNGRDRKSQKGLFIQNYKEKMMSKNVWLARRCNKILKARFLNEAIEAEKRWSAFRSILDGVSPRYERAVTAVMMEGQRLVNEQPIIEGENNG